MTLSNDELEEAVVEYLKRRGVVANVDQIKIVGISGSATYTNLTYEARVGGINLPPQEGPYR